MRYLDASIPLALMLSEPRDKLSDIRDLMLAIESGRERVATSVFTLAEIVYVLERENKKEETVKKLVEDLACCSGLKIVNAQGNNILDHTLDVYVKYRIDFIDSHHIATMKHLGIKEIYALDPHYDRVEGIIRLERLVK